MWAKNIFLSNHPWNVVFFMWYNPSKYQMKYGIFSKYSIKFIQSNALQPTLNWWNYSSRDADAKVSLAPVFLSAANNFRGNHLNNFIFNAFSWIFLRKSEIDTVYIYTLQLRKADFTKADLKSSWVSLEKHKLSLELSRIWPIN